MHRDVMSPAPSHTGDLHGLIRGPKLLTSTLCCLSVCFESNETGYSRLFQGEWRICIELWKWSGTWTWRGRKNEAGDWGCHRRKHKGRDWVNQSGRGVRTKPGRQLECGWERVALSVWVLELESIELKSWFCHFQTEKHWASCWASLSLTFLTSKIGMMIIHLSELLWELIISVHKMFSTRPCIANTQ